MPQYRVWLPPKNNRPSYDYIPNWIDLNDTGNSPIDWNAFGRDHPRVRHCVSPTTTALIVASRTSRSSSKRGSELKSIVLLSEHPEMLAS